MVDLYNQRFKRSVIKKEITLNNLISLAKKQQKMGRRFGQTPYQRRYMHFKQDHERMLNIVNH